jgi:hypothetical protein
VVTRGSKTSGWHICPDVLPEYNSDLELIGLGGKQPLTVLGKQRQSQVPDPEGPRFNLIGMAAGDLGAILLCRVM